MIYLKTGETYIYKSKKHKTYRITVENGEITARHNRKKVKVTKEILDNFSAVLPHYTVYTDGGCISNPGGPGAWAAVLISDTKQFKKISGSFPDTTNNRMEIFAVKEALKRLPDCIIDLYSDSQYVLNILDGKWKASANYDLWEGIEAARTGKTIKTHWVKGHSGDCFNEMCDELCTKEMEKYHVPGKPAKGAMSKVISVPVTGEAFETSKDSYTEIYEVNPICAETIIAFLSSPARNFKAYASLKAGGKDKWSDMTYDDFAKMFGKDITRAALDNFSNVRSAEYALRWHARGLALEDAIRKVYVDEEINDKMKK